MEDESHPAAGDAMFIESMRKRLQAEEKLGAAKETTFQSEVLTAEQMTELDYQLNLKGYGVDILKNSDKDQVDSLLQAWRDANPDDRPKILDQMIDL